MRSKKSQAFFTVSALAMTGVLANPAMAAPGECVENGDTITCSGEGFPYQNNLDGKTVIVSDGAKTDIRNLSIFYGNNNNIFQIGNNVTLNSAHSIFRLNGTNNEITINAGSILTAKDVVNASNGVKITNNGTLEGTETGITANEGVVNLVNGKNGVIKGVNHGVKSYGAGSKIVNEGLI